MTVTSVFITAVGLAAPAVAPAVAATQSTVAVNPDRSPGNARMTDGKGKQVQAFELELAIGPSVLLGEPANPSYQESFSRWGVEVAGSFTYRARYFLQPTIFVGYAQLAAGESNLPDNMFYGPGGTMEQNLSAWVISPGVTFPFWRFRLNAGIGLGIAQLTNTFRDDENSVTQLGLLNHIALSFDAVKTERMRFAVQVMSTNSPGLKLHWFSLGVSLRGDFVQWD